MAEELLPFQKKRISIGRKILKTYVANEDVPCGHLLRDTYLAASRHDPNDLPSNVIDIVADFGYFVSKTGGDFDEVLKIVATETFSDGDSDADRGANMLLQLKPIFDEEMENNPPRPPFEPFSFLEAVRRGADHVGFEMENLDVADIVAAGGMRV